MCLSTVFEQDETNDIICLLRNVAKVQIYPKKIVFTNLMGAQTVYVGSLRNIDLLENVITVGTN